MTKPMYRTAVEKAKSIDVELRADDKRLNKGCVFLIHDDGSTFCWNSAFVKRWNDYVMVFTEHHGFHVYDNDDVEFVAEIPRNKKRS